MKAKIQEQLDERSHGNHVTATPLGGGKWGADVKTRGVYQVGTDAVDSFDSDANEITAASHAALAGDTIRFTSGAASGTEASVYSVETNTIKVAEDLPTDPGATDAFSILRTVTQTLTSGGGGTSITSFIKDGSTQNVTLDTSTPANNEPLPVLITGADGQVSITAANLNMDVQLDHDSANPDAVQVGDGTETLLISAAGEAQTKDDTAAGILTTIDTDTGAIATSTASIDGKITACNTGAVVISSELPAGTQNIGDVDVASSVLPTGAATSALQTSSEAILTTIDTDTGVIAGDTTSIDGKITACNTGAVVISGALPAGSANIGDVDIASSVLPTGASTSALQTTGNTSLGNIEAGYAAEGAALGSGVLMQGDDGTDRTNVLVDTDGHLQIDVLSGATGGTEYTEGDTDATITGKAILWEDTADTLRPVSAAKPLPTAVISSALPTGAATESTLSTLDGKVTACNTGAVTISAALPAGSNNIGDVDVVSTVNPTGRSSVELIRNDYTSTSVLTSGYTQLVASTSGTINLLDIFDSSGETLVFATGAAASEVDQFYITPGGNGQVSLNIASSTRLSVKAVSATASVGELVINALS